MKKLITLCVAFGFLQLYAVAETVVGVIDGDTLVLSDTGKVELSGIDAPELNQLGGVQAKGFLTLLVRDKNVLCLQLREREKKGMPCEIYVGPYNINEMMVLHGWAWDNKDFSNSRYEDAMIDAQINKVGIWYEGSRNIEPWQWRAMQK